MIGNVHEWCADWYGPYPDHAETNPRGPASGDKRLLRGGSFEFYDFYCRVGFRLMCGPDCHYFDFGFRCARDGR